MEDVFGPPISVYTRAQALDDGFLVDVSETAREAGFKFPCVVTRRVWAEVIEPSERLKGWGQSIEGRLWDVVWMASCGARTAPLGEDRITFKVAALHEDDKGQPCHKLHELVLHIGPGDTPEPVLTIMFPGED